MVGLTFGLACACADSAPVASAARAPVAAPQAAISVSEQNPAVGDTVLVSASATLTGTSQVGSYFTAMTFDPTMLRYLGASPLSGMRVVNLVGDTVLAAGAAPQGLPDPWMFAASFVVLKPNPFTSLHLQLRELNGVDFVNVSNSVRPSPITRGTPPPSGPDASRSGLPRPPR
jgi:hypothetical protein